jgi:flagellar biosynthesis protein FlhG
MELVRWKMDQAEGLRKLMASETGKAETSVLTIQKLNQFSQNGFPRVISVTSGKGGVGKTNIVANLAYAFTQLGKKVLVMDADLGLSNIDVLLGLSPRFTIEHFFRREKTLSEILIKGPGGMSILPASSGVYDLVNLDETQKLLLLNEIDLFSEHIDLFLIDTGAGISSNVLYFNMVAQESIVISTSEPTSMTDAYALMKVLFKQFDKKDFQLLINLVPNDKEAFEVYKRITRVADHYLNNISINYLGFIPLDEKLPMAVKMQKTVLEAYPRAPSSRSLLELAKTICDQPIKYPSEGGLQFFWRRFLNNKVKIELEGEGN